MERRNLLKEKEAEEEEKSPNGHKSLENGNE